MKIDLDLDIFQWMSIREQLYASHLHRITKYGTTPAELLINEINRLVMEEAKPKETNDHTTDES